MSREELIKFRVTDEEKWVIQDRAEELGISVSALMRIILKDYFEKLNIMY